MLSRNELHEGLLKLDTNTLNLSRFIWENVVLGTKSLLSIGIMWATSSSYGIQFSIIFLPSGCGYNVGRRRVVRHPSQFIR